MKDKKVIILIIIGAILATGFAFMVFVGLFSKTIMVNRGTKCEAVCRSESIDRYHRRRRVVVHHVYYFDVVSPEKNKGHEFKLSITDDKYNVGDTITLYEYHGLYTRGWD